MTQFLLVRHGLTDAVGSVLTGRQAGVHLNAEGRAQAARVAEALSTVPLDAVVSSPLERAIDTAEPIAAGHGVAISVVDAFTELGFGEWTGGAFSALDATAGWQGFNSVRSLARPPGGELMLEAQQRAIAALIDLRPRYPDGRVVVVSHGDLIRAVLMFVLGVPLDFVHRLEVAPASISIVEFTDGAPRVRLVNGDSVPRAL